MGRQVGRSVLPAPIELMQSQSGNFFTAGNKVNFSLCATQTYFPSAASTAAALTQSKGKGGFFFFPSFSKRFFRSVTPKERSVGFGRDCVFGSAKSTERLKGSVHLPLQNEQLV